eukprot:3752965-Rhodomonas_salina.1
MGVDANIDFLKSIGILQLPPYQGVDVLMKLLWHPPTAVVTVCPMDPRQLVNTPYVRAVKVAPKGGRGGKDIKRTVWVETLRAMDTQQRHTEISAKIRAKVEQAGGVQVFDDHAQWGQAGLDSLSM